MVSLIRCICTHNRLLFCLTIIGMKVKISTRIIAGIDEAGRGPLAGPVVAAAVILPEKHSIEGLRDSKKLSQKKRKILYRIIKNHASSVGVGIISVKMIDELNIKEATMCAMKLALENLNTKPDKVLIDGFPLDTQVIPNEGIIRGDDLIDAIKAASIIAKVTRDKIMLEYVKIFPEYGFESHFGYGTKQHMAALKKYKSSPIHRKSYKPVKENMPSFEWLKKNNLLSWMAKKLAALFIKNKGLYIYEIDKMIDGFKIDIIARDNLGYVLIFVETIIKTNKINFEEQVDERIISDATRAIENMKKITNEKQNARIDLIRVNFSGKGKSIIDHYQNINKF